MAKILFFAPHSAIWVHAFPEALVAEALAKDGHDIVYVTCGEVYRRFCVPMRAAGLDLGTDDDARSLVCRDCDVRKRILRESFGLTGGDLSDQLAVDDFAKVKRVVASVSRANFLDLRILDVPVGRLALYECILDHKKQDFEFTDAEWQGYLIALNNVLLTVHALELVVRAASAGPYRRI